jgi:hypothetical protein
MASRDIRRHQRIACTVPVLLAWTSVDGRDCYARGRCRDISPAGLRLETVETIPTQSYVNLRIDIWDLAGSGRVRYTRRGSTGNIIGLELNQKVRQQILESLREPPSGS